MAASSRKHNSFKKIFSRDSSESKASQEDLSPRLTPQSSIQAAENQASGIGQQISREQQRSHSNSQSDESQNRVLEFQTIPYSATQQGDLPEPYSPSRSTAQPTSHEQAEQTWNRTLQQNDLVPQQQQRQHTIYHIIHRAPARPEDYPGMERAVRWGLTAESPSPTSFRYVAKGQGGIFQVTDMRMIRAIGTVDMDTSVGVYCQLTSNKIFFAHIDTFDWPGLGPSRQAPLDRQLEHTPLLPAYLSIRQRALELLTEIFKWSFPNDDLDMIHEKLIRHTLRIVYGTRATTSTGAVVDAICTFFTISDRYRTNYIRDGFEGFILQKHDVLHSHKGVPAPHSTRSSATIPEPDCIDEAVSYFNRSEYTRSLVSPSSTGEVVARSFMANNRFWRPVRPDLEGNELFPSQLKALFPEDQLSRPISILWHQDGQQERAEGSQAGNGQNSMNMGINVVAWPSWI